jgi:tripartite-type tricarboxylate transporter receptor subunit TctC
MRTGNGNCFLWAGAALVLATTTAIAQTPVSYPNKVVRIVLPYSPGGGTNIATRIFSEKLAKDTGQPFIVENRPGGATVAATQAVARSAPDGYTLLATTATLLINHWTQPNLPYDTLQDLVGISTLIRNDHMIAVHPTLPDVPTLAEAGLPGFSMSNWDTLLAPAATPAEIIEKINSYVASAQASGEVQELLAKQGIVPFPNSVAAANALVRLELEKFGKVIKDNNIKVDPEE